jgi:hypothetical protein
MHEGEHVRFALQIVVGGADAIDGHGQLIFQQTKDAPAKIAGDFRVKTNDDVGLQMGRNDPVGAIELKRSFVLHDKLKGHGSGGTGEGKEEGKERKEGKGNKVVVLGCRKEMEERLNTTYWK